MVQDPFGYHGITDKKFIDQQIDQQYNKFPTLMVQPDPDSGSFCEFKLLLFPIDAEHNEILEETARIYGDPVGDYMVSTLEDPFGCFGEYETITEAKSWYK